jgi:hypothetical protein
MANTYVKIATVNVGLSGAANINFSSIPGTYTDLVVKLSTRSTGGSANLYWNYNGGSGTAYSSKKLFGNGAAASSLQLSGVNYFQQENAVNNSGSTASTFNNCDIYLTNYSSTSTNKSNLFDGVTENNATTAYTVLSANLWADNSAITSIGFATDGNFVQYSTATLYGILKN